MQSFGTGRGILDEAQDMSAVGQKLPPRFRQAHAAVSAGQQASAHLLLKDLDLLAQRRLGDVEARRRSSKMQLFGNGDKIT
ncbi:hypothetical protein D3C86_1858220 [compost metagenome]